MSAHVPSLPSAGMRCRQRVAASVASASRHGLPSASRMSGIRSIVNEARRDQRTRRRVEHGERARRTRACRCDQPQRPADDVDRRRLRHRAIGRHDAAADHRRSPSVASSVRRHVSQRAAISAAASRCISTGMPRAWNAAAPNTHFLPACVMTTSADRPARDALDGGDDRFSMPERHAALDDDDAARPDDERDVGDATRDSPGVMSPSLPSG